ncbi:DUF4157 domain-containing protein [Bradyrhizobium ontarionense]|uniref:DUF4157 domain-containing protein n=1 Tax=Bradyrhizobium ontarionense TaxID=2898149 RepID=A0ABY3RE96_9BRAD|nr:DUF4157 domain-containing protein [Bradyrhizobium sp. A19]UFZ05156.1 DUF4157 domain-containing protein [Bradyrhizobium sp. A19]
MKHTATHASPHARQSQAVRPNRGFALNPPLAFPSGAAAPVTLQRTCACEETGEACSRCAGKRTGLQRFGTGAPPLGLPGAVGDVLRSPGQPMPPAQRTRMEEKFGQDFSAVRIHADASAQNSAAAVKARAYTVGRDIVFGSAAPDPASTAGQRLLGHELAHVVQQSRGGVAAGIDPDPRLETEARRAGETVAANGAVQVAGGAGRGLQRNAKSDAQEPTNANTDGPYLDDPDLLSMGYRQGDYAYVSEGTTIDNVPVKADERSYSYGREQDVGVEDAQKIYRAAMQNRYGVTPVVIDGEVAMVQGVGAEDQGEIIGNEVIVMHDLATEAEVTRRAGTSNPQTFETFSKQYQKERHTSEGVVKAFFEYRNAYSDELRKGYKIIDAAAGVANFSAKVVIAMIAGGGDPIAAFAPGIAGKGAEYSAKALGVNDEIAEGIGGLVETAAGMGNPAKMTTAQAIAPLVGMGAEKLATSLGVSKEDASLIGQGATLATGHAGSIGRKGPSVGNAFRASLHGPAGEAPTARLPAGKTSAAARTETKAPGILPHAEEPFQTKVVSRPEKTPAPTEVETKPITRPRGEEPLPAKTTATATTSPPKLDETAAAIEPNRATARKPADNGHDAVVTPEGVGRCSPTPCPVIQVEYKNELADNPDLKQWNDEVQGLRQTNPQRAADEAASLIRACEAARNNAQRSPEEGSGTSAASRPGPETPKGRPGDALAREAERLDAMRRIAARQEAALGKTDPDFAKRIERETAELQNRKQAAKLGKPAAPSTPPLRTPIGPKVENPLPPLQTGPYRNGPDAVAGHHVHQSASMSPRGTVSAKGNPNHNPAIAIRQNVPGFTEAQHGAASATQRNLNRAMHGETHEPNIGEVQIKSSGEGTSVTPSPYYEDVKAYFALRAAGRSHEEALDLVMRSRDQIDASGDPIIRVPTR